MDTTRTSMLRTRWAAIGAAVAVTLGGGGIGITHAVIDSDPKAVYDPLDSPCRLADLRGAPFTVGPRSAPLGPNETYVLDGWGSEGNCTLPSGTAAIEANVTAVDPTEATFLRFWPGDGAEPETANLNPTPGQPPTPNSVTIGLSAADGTFKMFNRFGSVNVIIDIVGVYDDHAHDGADIIDGSLTGADLADGSVASADIADGTITGADIADESVTGSDIDNGTVTNLDTSNEPGIARSFLGSQVAVSSDTVVSSVSIRVPSDGFVNVHVTGKWHGLSAGTDIGFCAITKGTTADASGSIRLNDGDGDASGSYRGFSGHATLEMDVADNPLLVTSGQVIRLVCDEGGGDDIRLDDVEMTATFFATSYAPSGIIIFPPLADDSAKLDGSIEGE